MPLRFGVLLIPERPVHELLGWATRFDEAGVDSLWVAEHLALPQNLDHPGGLTETRALLNGDRLAVPPAPELVRPGPVDIALSTPSPQLGKVPIVVGGHGSRSIDVAAKHANRWNTYGTRPGTEDVFEVLRRQCGQLSDRCVAIGRKPDDITGSVLLDFNPQLSPTSASELADVTRRLYELGFEECIAYAWLDGEVTRSTDELLSFVINTLPSLSAECN
jgi:alkanesulfonate monooxygenase SsuD/methylene tetrahydromethanopterin reductase-like flavin-dependent oxidoreductase (luciferase family)